MAFLDETGLVALWNKIKSFFVDKSTDQVIGGFKTFKNAGVLSNGNNVSKIILRNSDITKGTPRPSDTTSARCYTQILFADKDGIVEDSGYPGRLGMLEHTSPNTQGTGGTYMTLGCYAYTRENSNTARINVGFDADSIAYAEAPATSTTRTVATDIVTRGFVMGASGDNAHVGLVPAPPTTAGTTKYLREDGNWVAPPNDNTVYTHPAYTAKESGLYKVTVDATGHVSAATAVAKADITALGIPGSDTNTWTAMTGATSAANGTVGYVNAVPPKDGYNTKYLRADGSWVVPPNTNTWTAMTGATSAANGTVGYVNAVPPKDGYNTKFWRADGSWAVPPDTNTVYTHPSHTAKTSGLYKITVDALGHVSAATAVAKADITALGIPGSDTNTTYSNTSFTSTAPGTLGIKNITASTAAKTSGGSNGDIHLQYIN